MYGSEILVFCLKKRNVMVRTRVAFQCANDARITINAFYRQKFTFSVFW